MTTTAVWVDDSLITSGTHHIQEFAAQALDAGFDGMELLVRADTGVGVDETTGGMHSLTAGGQIQAPISALAARLTSVSVEHAMQTVRALLDRAAGLHATCLSLALPPLAIHANHPAEAGFARYQDSLNFAYSLLRDAGQHAEPTGVTIAVQGAVGGCLLSPVELREVIDAVNSWAVGVCVDMKDVGRIGDPLDWLVTLSHRVHAVRIRLSSPLPSRSGRGAMGSLVYKGLGEALKEIRYDRLIIAAGELPPRDLRAYLDAAIL